MKIKYSAPTAKIPEHRIKIHDCITALRDCVFNITESDQLAIGYEVPPVDVKHLRKIADIIELAHKEYEKDKSASPTSERTQ